MPYPRALVAETPLAYRPVHWLGWWGIVLLLWMADSQAAPKQVVGWLEYVHINEAAMRLEAKIDTGADTSSIHAKILKRFTRNGEEWIRFRLTDKHRHTVTLERKIERYARIKRKMAPSLHRLVIRLGICLGRIYREVDVNLARRKKFKYQMLIGRNFLKDIYLVDSSLKYSIQPACPGLKGD